MAPYADTALAYDAEGRVASMTTSGAGCSVCTGGLGTTTYGYATSTAPNSADYNAWQHQATATLPDGMRRITFTNFAGQTMLSVVQDASGRMWPTLTRYDDRGNAVLTAGPSAFAPDAGGRYYDAADPSLAGYDAEAGRYSYLSDTAGLITLTDYYDATGASVRTPGGAAGYVRDVKVRQGELGAAALQESMGTAARSSLRPLPCTLPPRGVGSWSACLTDPPKPTCNDSRPG